MDNQTVIPGNTGPFSSTPSSNGRSSVMMMLIIVLGLGTVIFGTLTVVFSSQAIKSSSQTKSQTAAAVAKARDEQKKADEAAATKLAESPFRTYTAPAELGSFVVNFPKTWSSYVDQEAGQNQVLITMNPDFLHKTNGIEAKVATRITLIQRTKDQFLTQYNGPFKTGTLKQATTTVSGLTAVDITGAFGDRKTVRQVVVPIRDKVLVFSCEDSAYLTEYSEILAQAKIIP